MKWRLTVLSLFVLLISFLSLGAVKEFGNDIPYPAQAAFSLTGSSEVDKNQIFDKIQEIADKKQLTIYRPFLDKSGQQATCFWKDTAQKSILYHGSRSLGSKYRDWYVLF